MCAFSNFLNLIYFFSIFALKTECYKRYQKSVDFFQSIGTIKFLTVLKKKYIYKIIIKFLKHLLINNLDSMHFYMVNYSNLI